MDAVKQELARIQAVYVEKRADVLDHIQSYLEANPEARTALMGAGVGGAAGLAHSFMKPKSRRTTVSDVLTGASLGGLAGGAGHFLHDTYAKAREAPRPVQAGGETYHVPRSLLRDQDFVKELGALREPSMVGRAADAVTGGIGSVFKNWMIPATAAIGGETLYQGATSNKPWFWNKGLGDTRIPSRINVPFTNVGVNIPSWLGGGRQSPFGPTLSTPRDSESILAAFRDFEMPKPKTPGKGDLYAAGIDDLAAPPAGKLFGGQTADELAHWRRSLGNDPTPHEVVNKFKGEFDGMTMDDVTRHGRGLNLGSEAKKLGAPKAHRFLGQTVWSGAPATRFLNAGRLGAYGLAGAGGLLAQDYFDTASREAKLKELLAQKLVVGNG